MDNCLFLRSLGRSHWLLAALLFSAQHLSAQEHARHSPTARIPDAIISAPIAQQSGIGNAHEQVTTDSPSAQAFYDQGLCFLYDYDWIHAGRSFHEALRVDPKLAMAYLGLSYAYSGFGDNAREMEVQEKASRFADRVSPAEHVRSELRRQQLESMRDQSSARISASYIRALDEALADDPGNIHLLLMRGVASEGYATAVGGSQSVITNGCCGWGRTILPRVTS